MKILFFDGWTKGIRNFSRLTDGLKKNGCSYKLFHIESWGDNNCPQEQVINGIKCYDIEFYKTSYIYEVLKKESPNVVLILSLSYLLDRTIVDMCHKLNIKVVYLAHGKIYMKQGVGNLANNMSLFKKIKSRITSKPVMILKNYIRFNLITTFHPIRIIKTLNLFLRHSNETMFTPYSEELKVDKGMVYYESERQMFEEKRHFPVGMIAAVGNPEMDYLINQKIVEEEEFLDSINFRKKKYAVYMDDGFVQEQILTYDEWKNFISEMYAPLKAKNVGLIIKLHPRTSVEPIKDFLKAEEILAVKDVDFKNLIYYSDFVFSHSSSTVIYGMIIDKPVILPRWGKLSELVRNYPDDTVYYCTAIKDYENLIDSDLKSKQGVKKYLQDNCGILDGMATKRIVDNIISFA